jgi:hypothetical protein
MSADQRLALRNPVLLQALQNKYRTLHDLRVQDAPANVTRATFAALSAAFPGALRELDRVPMSVLLERNAAIAAVLAGSAEPEPWMQLQSAYHGFMRAVLRIRRGLRERALHDFTDPQHCLCAVAYVPAADEPAAERFDRELLTKLWKPPSGRLNPLVMKQVAADHGVSVDVLERALFG